MSRRGPRVLVRPKAGWIGGNWFAFKNFAIWGPIVLYRHGDPRAGHGKVKKVERRLRFERIGNQTAYMACGLYGGSPDKSIWQPYWANHETRVAGN